MKSISKWLALAAVSGFVAASCSEQKYCNSVSIEGDSEDMVLTKAANVIPTSNQLSALENEFIGFIHWGPNTFTRNEWGNGMESPKTFAPEGLDTDQWCQAMKDAGMTMVILTAKHHDGFVLWQSRYTDHGVMSSDFMDGKADVMKSLSESCRKYGLKLGVYLSPADLYQIESPDGLYGNLSKASLRTIPREVPGRPFENKTKFEFDVDDYNEYYLNQLFELLTEYGPIHEVWLDGAHPKSKGGQTYNYMAWKELIHTLAPEAVVFGREDVRWCGNEAGRTRVAERNVIPYQQNPDTMSSFADIMAEAPGSMENLVKGNWLHYQPCEVNTSIRDGWFYRDDTGQKTRNADNVFDMYERAVGGNSIFLLNIPPDRSGKLPLKDVEVLEETGRRIRQTYGTDLLKGADGPAKVLDNNLRTSVTLSRNGGEFVVTTPEPICLNRIVLQENIATVGERAENYAVDAFVDGEWKEIASGSVIGYKQILRFDDVTTNKLRFRLLSSRLDAAISKIAAYYSQYPVYQGVAFQHPDKLAKDKFTWKTDQSSILVDLGEETRVAGIAYDPANQEQTVTGRVLASIDGQNWNEAATLNLGNLRNDKSERFVYFHNPVSCRWIRIEHNATGSGAPSSDNVDLF